MNADEDGTYKQTINLWLSFNLNQKKFHSINMLLKVVHNPKYFFFQCILINIYLPNTKSFIDFVSQVLYTSLSISHYLEVGFSGLFSGLHRDYLQVSQGHNKICQINFWYYYWPEKSRVQDKTTSQFPGDGKILTF